MAHIFRGYLYIGLKAVLERNPTTLETQKAIEAIEKEFGENALVVFSPIPAAAKIKLLRKAIQKTLDENGHLADGENCTLIELKRAMK